MSQVISGMENGTEKGIQIQMHLDKIYDELISETYGKMNENTNNIIQKLATPCIGCGSPITYIIWSDSYSGYRGKCIGCNHNWPES